MARTSTFALNRAASSAVPLILRWTNSVSVGGMCQVAAIRRDLHPLFAQHADEGAVAEIEQARPD